MKLQKSSLGSIALETKAWEVASTMQQSQTSDTTEAFPGLGCKPFVASLGEILPDVFNSLARKLEGGVTP